jgi:hypothetical protein
VLKLKEPNALNLFGLRRIELAPPHYESITVPLSYNLEHSIERWIMSHLKGRFFIVKTTGVDNTDSINVLFKIGFEDKRELSLFTLGCPHLKYK